ncbi:Uncharacterised protein [Vibrio cholerae]|nr:Uncharacterised protein [Vibrio cholerae]
MGYRSAFIQIASCERLSCNSAETGCPFLASCSKRCTDGC